MVCSFAAKRSSTTVRINNVRRNRERNCSYTNKSTFKLPLINRKLFFEKDKCQKRFHNSKRHTIQKDPIVYNDEVILFLWAKIIKKILKNKFLG